LLALSPATGAQSVITTFAGTDWIFPDDGKRAVNGAIGRIVGVASDPGGTIHIADVDNAQVMRITNEGILQVVAGNGIIGYSGDGGRARDASLRLPYGIAFDKSGNLYISSSTHHVIRRVGSDGTITLFAGNGKAGFSGDGGPAVQASLNAPKGLAVDGAGNVYVADSDNHRIRRIGTDGVITTFAGDGQPRFQGDGGAALTASLNAPAGIAFDSSGNLLIADTFNHRIRRISSNTITTIAGREGKGFSGDGGGATAAALDTPNAVAVDAAGRIFVTDAANHRVRVISGGQINTFAGNGKFELSGDGGPATQAGLNFPSGVAVDAAGNLLIADFQNSRVRRVGSNGVISSVAGSGAFRLSADQIPAITAALQIPSGIAIDRSGNVFIAENQRPRVRKVTPDGTITTVIGNGFQGFSGEGVSATTASLFSPSRLALDSAGNLYVSDNAYHRVRRVNSDGLIRTVAGTGQIAFAGDGGPATAAALNQPEGIALDESNNLYIADQLNHRIRRVSPQGIISTVAGTGEAGFSGDGGAATAARLNQPTGVTVDAGNLYIAERGGNRVRKVTASGIISTVAGNGSPASTGDGGSALQASLHQPGGVAVDRSGNIYIAELFGSRVRIVTPEGMISTFAGDGTPGFRGDGGPPANAGLNIPADVKLDANGNVFIADAFNDRVRKITGVGINFQVEPSAISFRSDTAGEAVPANIRISSSVQGLAYSVTATAANSGQWLSVTPAAGTLPSSPQVTVNPAGLAPGQYAGTVTVTAPLATPTTRQITVTLEVPSSAQPAKLAVGSQAINLNFQQGESPSNIAVSISNQGGGTLAFTASVRTTTGGSWLTVAPEAGQVTAGGTTPVNLTVTPGNLAEGTYSGTLTVTGGGETRAIPVTMSITRPRGKLLLSQTGLTFTAVEGGGSPSSQTIGVLNEGAGELVYEARVTSLKGGAWLRLNNATGRVVLPLQDVSFIEAVPDTRTLAQGEYYAEIRVSSPGNIQTVVVVLKVLARGSNPGPEVNPTGLIFIGAPGSSPSSESIRITNLLPSAISYASSTLTFDGAKWVNHLPTNATVNPNEPRQLVVQPDFAGVQAGIKRGVLTLVFADGTFRVVSILSVVADGVTAANKDGIRQAVSCSSPVLRSDFLGIAEGTTFNVGQPVTIEVKVVDECGNLVLGTEKNANSAVYAKFSNGDPEIRLVPIGGGRWKGTWRPVTPSAGPVTIAAVSVFVQGLTVQAGRSDRGVRLETSNAPIVKQGSLVQSASQKGDAPVAPGTLVSIYGSNLAEKATASPGFPLPTELDGTQVLLAGQALPLLYSSSTQINAQVPYNLPVNELHQVIVRRGETLSVPEGFTVSSAQPGIFTQNQQGSGQGIIVGPDQVSLATAATPARRGGAIVIYCAGLGAVSPAVPPGVSAPSNPIASVVGPVTVTVGGTPASVFFAGLAPGFAGLYQVNAILAADTPVGDEVPVVIVSDGRASNTATIAVR